MTCNVSKVSQLTRACIAAKQASFPANQESLEVHASVSSEAPEASASTSMQEEQGETELSNMNEFG